VGLQYSHLSSQHSEYCHHAASSIHLLTTEWSTVQKASLSEAMYEIEKIAIIDIPNLARNENR
jgi:hypothetical protein